MSPGARFIVVFVKGGLNPLFDSAEETRFKDSFTAVSGRPTIKVRGSPRSPVLTSISTSNASTPIRAPEFTFASIEFYKTCGVYIPNLVYGKHETCKFQIFFALANAGRGILMFTNKKDFLAFFYAGF